MIWNSLYLFFFFRFNSPLQKLKPILIGINFLLVTVSSRFLSFVHTWLLNEMFEFESNIFEDVIGKIWRNWTKAGKRRRAKCVFSAVGRSKRKDGRAKPDRRPVGTVLPTYQGQSYERGWLKSIIIKRRIKSIRFSSDFYPNYNTLLLHAVYCTINIYCAVINIYRRAIFKKPID